MMSNSYFRAPEAQTAPVHPLRLRLISTVTKNNSDFISNAEFTLNLSIENETDISQQINFFTVYFMLFTTTHRILNGSLYRAAIRNLSPREFL